jgi:hypothetical protein
MRRFNNLNNNPYQFKKNAGQAFWSIFTKGFASGSFGMKKRQLIAAGLFFSLPLLMVPGFSLHASADDILTTSTTPIFAASNEPSCTPDPSLFTHIKAIQNDPTLSYLEEIKAELAVRKQLLAATITCAKSDAETLKTSLTAITPSQNFVTLQSQLAGQLDEAMAYYDLELQKSNTAGLSGTQAVAKDLLSWRESNYAPLAENVSNFILWSQNQAVFTVAASRLGQVKSLVGSVPFSENAELQSDLQESIVSLQSAQDENTKAGQAFSQSLPPDQTLALIQQSLGDLAATYQHFFDISSLVQTLLPH